MTLSDYIIFTTVSELKNMSLASDKLYLTRSAISHAISRIEREIGFPLFIKNTHGIELTDNGAALLPLAYAVIQNHQHFNEKIAAINGLASGNVRLGTCSSICINWIPELVNNFRHHYPDIQIHIFAGINNAQIVKNWSKMRSILVLVLTTLVILSVPLPSVLPSSMKMKWFVWQILIFTQVRPGSLLQRNCKILLSLSAIRTMV